MRFTAKTCRVLEMQNFTPDYMKGWTYVHMDNFVRTKISWMHRKPDFLTHGAQLHALCVHESSAITKCGGILYVNREEKSLGYIAMGAKFLNDNKSKIHLKRKFALFHLFCQILAKFSGFNLRGPYLSLEKEKETFCVVFTYSIMGAREIRKFHVTVVQRRPRSLQKSVQSCCLLI